MDKYTIPVCNLIFSERKEVSETFEAPLAEHYPNIQKIIKADALVNEVTSSEQNGKICVDVKICVRANYLTEPGGVVKFVSFPFDFQQCFDFSPSPEEKDNLLTEASAFPVALTFKPKGNRSMEFKINMSVGVCVFDCSEHPLFNPESVGDAEMRPQYSSCALHVKICTSPTEIHEDITLDASMSPIAEICDSNAVLLLNDIVTEDEALKYTGSAIFKCTYRAEGAGEGAGAEYVNLVKEFPFSGEITDERLKHGMSATGKITVCNIETGSSFDPYGENRIINTTITYSACFDVFDETEFEYFDDGFCPTYECDFVKDSCSFERLSGKIKDGVRISENLSADRTGLAEINDAAMLLNITSTEISDSKLFANGKACVWISGTDEKGEPECMQSVFGVHLPIESVRDASPDKRYLLNTQVASCFATLRDGQILLDADAETDGIILEKCRVDAIVGADIHYDSPKPLCKSEYIICYPSGSETLWDISKKYEVSREELKKANNLESENISGRKTIIIPCFGA